jgi:hypothetical protein
VIQLTSNDFLMCVGFRRGSHHQETVPQGEDRVLGQVEGMESKVWLSVED